MPGKVCAVLGEAGVDAQGVAMVCSDLNPAGNPYGDGKLRWRRA